MKLKWPLWLIVAVWMILHGVGFFSLALGWLLPIGLVGGIVIYIIYGAFAQSIGYGVIVGKKTLQAWKTGIMDTSGPSQANASTVRSRSWGFFWWLILPIIIYLPFFIIAINEK